MDMITKRKWDRFQPHDPRNSFCTGSKRSYVEDYRDDGYGFIEWSAPQEELPDVEQILQLVLLPGKAHLKKAVFPTFVPALSHLAHAVFELDFLYSGQATKLSPSVRSLVLSRDLSQAEGTTARTGWESLELVPGLEAMLLIGDEEKEPVTRYLSSEWLPRLAHLGFTLSQTQELTLFQRFSGLTDLELANLRDYPIFEHIRHLPLVSLDLTGTNPKFDPSGLTALASLQMLRLNGLRCEFDCQLLGALPNLQELVVLNSKKLKNVESLLEMKALTRLSFLDCANPFKKGLYQRFASHGYEEFDAKYA